MVEIALEHPRVGRLINFLAPAALFYPSAGPPWWDAAHRESSDHGKAVNQARVGSAVQGIAFGGRQQFQRHNGRSVCGKWCLSKHDTWAWSR